MSGFTGSALGDFAKGMRTHELEEQQDERHNWARQENDRAGDRHKWAGETHQALNFRRGLQNKILKQQVDDSNDFRSALKFKGLTPGKMKADNELSAWKKSKYDADLRTLREGVQYAEITGDYSGIAEVLSNTFHGTTPEGKKKKYVFEPLGDEGFRIINPDKGNVALHVKKRPGESLHNAVVRSIFPLLQDVETYFSQEADIAKAKRLAGIQTQSAITLADHNLKNKKELVRYTQGIKGQGERYITLPRAIGGNEKLTYKEARQEMADLGKNLKEMKGSQDMAFFVDSDVNPDDLFKSDSGKLAIERIEQIAQSDTDSRARRFAQRFLAIADQMYSSPQQSGSGDHGPALNIGTVGRGNTAAKSKTQSWKQWFDPTYGR